jgi:hypothetical protein
MSTQAQLPGEFSNVLKRFRFDPFALAEVESAVLRGIEELRDAGVVPGSGVYRGAIDDLTDFLEEAQRQASAAGQPVIDSASLQAARFRFPAIWPFFK